MKRGIASKSPTRNGFMPSPMLSTTFAMFPMELPNNV